MDNVNFSAEKIESYFDEIVEAIFAMHEESMLEKIAKQNEENQEKEEQLRNENSARSDEMDLNNIEGLDDYTKMLVTQLRNKGKMTNLARENTQNNSEQILEEYKEKIRGQLNNYRNFWTSENLNMVTILDEFGNQRYKIDKKRNKINYHMITLINDAAYVGKYFDVLSWWMANDNLYPELAIIAALVLGKPTHNGFQERVFSRGSYQDTKLKKRLKEENFEMSVLNAINNRKINDLKGIMDLGLESLINEISEADREVVQEQQVQEIQQFFDKGNDNKEMVIDDEKQKTNDIDKESDDEDDPSIFSYCSEKFDLDDGGDDLSIAQIYNMMNMEDTTENADNVSFELVEK
jgi:hypothetical protein